MAAKALLYDIHGNLEALEAVLENARSAGVERFVLGGDYTLFGPWPEKTVARLRELDHASWIRGNGERWTADPAQAPDNDVVQGAIAACRKVLGDRLVGELAELAEQLVIEDTRFCHGSPISDVRSLMPQPADDEAELLAGITESRLVFGHTHLPFARRSAAGLELVNPGSVGMPFDGDTRASYALMHEDGRVEHRRVEYDHAAAADTVRAVFGDVPWTETVVRRIATAHP